MDALVGQGPSTGEAVDGLLAALEQQFVDEVGPSGAQTITLATAEEDPSVLDEQLALELVAAMTGDSAG